MKKVSFFILTALILGMLVVPMVGQASEEFNAFGVYMDRGSRQNHYAPSGWMGDFGDIKFTQNHKDSAYSGKSCIRIIYSAQGKQGANWAGMYWQWPPNNWGEKSGGYDLSGAKKISFWARGDKGGEQITEFKIGGLTGTYSDSDSNSIGPIELTADWAQYEIDLSDLDLSYISGGFAWVTNAMANPEGCTFYLDDITYE